MSVIPPRLPGHEERVRLTTLDLLRFAAAIMVVLYHYTFRGPINDTYTTLTYHEIDGVTRYGFLGVDLFFMISGFVILMTVEAGRGRPMHFVASRISRLFPAFWVAATVTFLVCVVVDAPTQVAVADFVRNLGMLPSWLGAEYVDGVYWTLERELYFYAMVVGYLAFLSRRLSVEWALAGWLLLTAALAPLDVLSSNIRTVLLVNVAPFFITGCALYLVWRGGWTRLRALIVGGSWLAASYSVTQDVTLISRSFGTELLPIVAIGIVSVFFIVLIILSSRPGALQHGGTRAIALGALTYALYLTHQYIGYVEINVLDGFLDRWGVLIVTVALALLVAYAIHRFVERRYNQRLRRAIETHVGGRIDILWARGRALPMSGGDGDR